MNEWESRLASIVVDDEEPIVTPRDEWESRLANVVGAETPLESNTPKFASSDLTDSRNRIFIITNRSRMAVELSIPVYGGDNQGASPALDAVQIKLCNGSIKQSLLPGSSTPVFRSDFIQSGQIRQLIVRGVLSVKPKDG